MENNSSLNKENSSKKQSKILVNNRDKTNLYGVTKVNYSNENSISLNLCDESFLIEEKDLHITKLDIDSLIVDIDGTINSMKFTKSKNEKNLFKRIFF